MLRTILFFAVIGIFITAIQAQTTEFTYQGYLKDGVNAANGNYDFEFALFDALTAGTQLGSTQQRNAVAVSNGVFSVKLDFGAQFPGANRFLEIRVRLAGQPAYTALTPRQLVNSAPYSVRSLNSTTADVATNATQLGGVAANQFVQTSDPRLSDARVPLPNSANYIQNQNAATQASSSFNISGNGIVGGNLGIGTSNPFQLLHVKSQPGSHATSMIEAPTGFSAQLLLQSVSANPWTLLTQSNLAGGALMIRNGGTDIMAMNPDGRVGIGTTDPQAILHMMSPNGSLPLVETPTGIFSGYNFRSGPSGGFWGIGTQDTLAGGAFIFRRQTSIQMVISVSGNVGISTSDPQRLLHVNGRARIGSIPLEASAAQVCFNASGDLLQCGASSLRWKTNVQAYRNGLDIIRQLNPISYNWKAGGQADMGLGAEDVAKVAPSLTFQDANGEIAGVKYEKLSMLFINAFKEQQEQIKAQKDEIESLKLIVCELKPAAAMCEK